MKNHTLLISVLLVLCGLLSACAPSNPASNPNQTDGPQNDYVEGVGNILSSISTTVFPQSIHSGENALWYWFEECRCVVKFDIATGAEVATIKLADGKAGSYGNPKDAVVGEDAIWTTDTAGFGVIRIDPNSNRVTEQIPLEFEDAAGKIKKVQPFGLALEGTSLWISDFDGNFVVRLNVETKKIDAVINDIPSPEGIAVSPGSIWVVEHRSNQIVRIDSASNQVAATISFPGVSAPGGKCGMCINHLSATDDAIWIPLNRGNGVARIDPKTNKVVAVIPLDAPVHDLVIGDTAIWAVGSSLGPACKSDGFLARINLQTNTLVGKLSIPCAFSVAIHEGDVWVGAGIPMQSQFLTLVKPD
jgi:streptogramin lyase